MHSAADLELERAELAAVLASGILNRAPNLAHVLTYVCERYFEGAAEQIKEYNIAVEALGRPPDFDQKRDSIVRVEAHRLRKRLRDYYEAEGAGHRVRIDIPPGQYAPHFLRQPDAISPLPALPAMAAEEVPEFTAEAEPASDGDALPALEVADTEPVVRPPAPAHQRERYSLMLSLAVLVLLTGGAFIWRAPAHVTANSNTAGVAPVNPVSGQDVRILAGLESGSYTDRFGHRWESDRYFTGGSVFEAGGRHILGAGDSRLFQTRREGTFSYDIPLPPGTYEMRLYFAETLYGENNMAGGGETSRIFNVFANGTPILHQFDIICEAGSNSADIRAFKDISPAADGKLHLRFEPSTNPAILSGIEITPGVRGSLRPIRMVSREHPYTDRQGRTWESDRYSRGGQLVQRTDPISNADDPDLLGGERYGNLRYVIPVPPGRYAVTLYFAETWFGPGKFAGGGVGSRIFDILCNGTAFRRNFDIFKEARGSDRAFPLTLRSIEPDAQGKITISLLPVRNYASINALEVVDESR